MDKKNCWELARCGLEPGGLLSARYGICSAAAHAEEGIEGPNGGSGAGRACWAMEGTQCGHLPGSIASVESKFASCIACAVFQRICQEEGSSFELGMEPHPKRAAS